MSNACNSWISLCGLTSTASTRGKKKGLSLKSNLTVYVRADDVIFAFRKAPLRSCVTVRSPAESCRVR